MKKIVNYLFVIGFMLGMITVGCAPKSKPMPVLTPKPIPEVGAPVAAKATWEAEWENTLKEARKEGSVVVVGGSTVAGLKDSISLFKEKFGIELDTLSGKGGELSAKLNRERSAGLYTQDVMITGQTSMIDLKLKGVFDSLPPMLVLPEVVNQELWYDGKFDWADTEGRYLFNFALYPVYMVYINTDLVKQGEIQSYHDLLDPKWKGNIVVNDPTIAGTGASGFISMVHNKIVDMDFFPQLVAQEPMVTRNQDLQATWIAKGKYPIGLWTSPGSVVRFTQAGAPVRPVDNIKEGTHAGSAGSALSLLNKAPHPNAAKVFINWFLSKGGQAINQKIVAKQTRRVDVGIEGLDPSEMRKPGVKYFPKHDEKEDFIINEVKRHNELAKEFFAPLLK